MAVEETGAGGGGERGREGVGINLERPFKQKHLN